MRINHHRRRRNDLSIIDRFSELSVCNIICLSFIGFTLGWLLAQVVTYHLVMLYADANNQRDMFAGQSNVHPFNQFTAKKIGNTFFSCNRDKEFILSETGIFGVSAQMMSIHFAPATYVLKSESEYATASRLVWHTTCPYYLFVNPRLRLVLYNGPEDWMTLEFSSERLRNEYYLRFIYYRVLNTAIDRCEANLRVKHGEDGCICQKKMDDDNVAATECKIICGEKERTVLKTSLEIDQSDVLMSYLVNGIKDEIIMPDEDPDDKYNKPMRLNLLGGKFRLNDAEVRKAIPGLVNELKKVSIVNKEFIGAEMIKAALSYFDRLNVQKVIETTTDRKLFKITNKMENVLNHFDSSNVPMGKEPFQFEYEPIQRDYEVKNCLPVAEWSDWKLTKIKYQAEMHGPEEIIHSLIIFTFKHNDGQILDVRSEKAIPRVFCRQITRGNLAYRTSAVNLDSTGKHYEHFGNIWNGFDTSKTYLSVMRRLNDMAAESNAMPFLFLTQSSMGNGCHKWADLLFREFGDKDKGIELPRNVYRHIHAPLRGIVE